METESFRWGNSAEMFFLEKSLIFVAAFAFCEVSCAKITLEQMQQASEPIRMVCIQKTKVSEELLANLRAGKLDDQKELKCYVNCVIEMMQMVRMKRTCESFTTPAHALRTFANR